MSYLKTDETNRYIVEGVIEGRRAKRRRKKAKRYVDKRAMIERKLPDLGPIPALDESTGRLLDMLSYRRPADSDSEAEFIDTFIRPTGAVEDAYGNLWLTQGDAPILWSVHTDTVHHDPGRQSVMLKGPLAFTPDAGSNCLGADDTAGLWLALEMIRAGVAGTYLFHRGEEIGGAGSSWVARERPDYLAGFKAAIALDRKGYGDVITHQAFERCCSEPFARSLAAILGGEYKPSDDGVFTDTANYTGEIGECTNLSVGYFDQHGPTECVNITFLANLRDTLIAADWTGLVYERQPGEVDADWGLYGRWGADYSYGGGGHNHGGRGAEVTYYDRNDSGGSRRFNSGSTAELIQLVKNYPEAIADVLEHDGWTADALEHWLDQGEGRLA